MRLALIRFLLLITVPFLQSCDAPKKAGLYGHVYFASGNYLGEFDLHNGTSSIVANRGDVSIRQISSFGDNRLLIAELATINDRSVPRISWIDLKTGRAETLLSGVVARHMPAIGAIVYDDGSRLHAMSLRRDPDINAVIAWHNLNQISTIIDISNEVVLFESGLTGQRMIQSYNIVTKELRQLAGLSRACRLADAIWLDDLEKLACKQWPGKDLEGDYVFADLDGRVGGKLALSDGKDLIALAYIQDQNTLLMTERWPGVLFGTERFAVWAYDVSSGSSYRLVRDQYLGQSAVFSET